MLSHIEQVAVIDFKRFSTKLYKIYLSRKKKIYWVTPIPTLVCHFIFILK